MNENNKVLARGMYRHDQRESFVSVREYMFIRKKDKKCLVLRFFNETEDTLDSIEYTLNQLDLDGQVIDTNVITHSNFRAAPGRLFTPKIALVLNDDCVDFRIEITKAMAGMYMYHLRGDSVVVDYGAKDFLHTAHKKERSDYSVSPRKNYKPGRRTGWLIVLIALFCAFSVTFSIFKQLYREYEAGEFDFWGILPEKEIEEDG